MAWYYANLHEIYNTTNTIPYDPSSFMMGVVLASLLWQLGHTFVTFTRLYTHVMTHLFHTTQLTRTTKSTLHQKPWQLSSFDSSWLIIWLEITVAERRQEIDRENCSMVCTTHTYSCNKTDNYQTQCMYQKTYKDHIHIPQHRAQSLHFVTMLYMSVPLPLSIMQLICPRARYTFVHGVQYTSIATSPSHSKYIHGKQYIPPSTFSTSIAANTPT